MIRKVCSRPRKRRVNDHSKSSRTTPYHVTSDRITTYTNTFQHYYTPSCTPRTITLICHHSAPSRTIQHHCTTFHTIPHYSAPPSTNQHHFALFRTIQHESAPFRIISHYSVSILATVLPSTESSIILCHSSSSGCRNQNMDYPGIGPDVDSSGIDSQNFDYPGTDDQEVEFYALPRNQPTHPDVHSCIHVSPTKPFIRLTEWPTDH